MAAIFGRKFVSSQKDALNKKTGPSFFWRISFLAIFIFFVFLAILFRLYFFGGLISALLLTFGGNLHTVYKIGQKMITDKATLSEASSSYWYPDATRFIGFDPDTTDKTIHEFPIYSFVVADLHGHMNDIPLILFFTAFLFAAFTGTSKLSSYLFIPSGFLLSLAYMTNAWDFAVYGLLFGLSFLLLKKNLWQTIFYGLSTIAAWFL
jgi:uncharacterized membrane protein